MTNISSRAALDLLAAWLEGDLEVGLPLSDALREAGHDEAGQTLRTLSQEGSYRCVHVHKEVEEDDHQQGIVGPRYCAMSEKLNIQAPDLKTLVKRVGDFFSLEIDDVFIAVEDDEPVRWFDFDRLETEDGSEPTKGQLARWRKGRHPLFHAVYSFEIEKGVVHKPPVLVAEFDRAGIKYHQ